MPVKTLGVCIVFFENGFVKYIIVDSWHVVSIASMDYSDIGCERFYAFDIEVLSIKEFCERVND